MLNIPNDPDYYQPYAEKGWDKSYMESSEKLLEVLSYTRYLPIPLKDTYKHPELALERIKLPEKEIRIKLDIGGSVDGVAKISLIQKQVWTNILKDNLEVTYKIREEDEVWAILWIDPMKKTYAYYWVLIDTPTGEIRMIFSELEGEKFPFPYITDPREDMSYNEEGLKKETLQEMVDQCLTYRMR